jgi:hypothetical protein
MPLFFETTVVIIIGNSGGRIGVGDDFRNPLLLKLLEEITPSQKNVLVKFHL